MKRNSQKKAERSFEEKYNITISEFKNSYGKYISHFYYLRVLVSDFHKIYQTKLLENVNASDSGVISDKIEFLGKVERLMAKYELLFCRYADDEMLQALYNSIPLDFDFIRSVRLFGDFLRLYDIKDTSELTKSFSYEEFAGRRHQDVEHTVNVISEGEYRDRFRNYLESLTENVIICR